MWCNMFSYICASYSRHVRYLWRPLWVPHIQTYHVIQTCIKRVFCIPVSLLHKFTDVPGGVQRQTVTSAGLISASWTRCHSIFSRCLWLSLSLQERVHADNGHPAASRRRSNCTKVQGHGEPPSAFWQKPLISFNIVLFGMDEPQSKRYHHIVHMQVMLFYLC